MVSGVGVTTHATQKLVTTKGSVNNKVNCAAEHLKNDVKTFTQLGLVGGAVGLVGYKKPDYIKKLAKVTGNLVGKVGKFLAEKVVKKGFGTGLLNKVLKNPGKTGAIGLAAAGGLWVINKLCEHSYNSGQIEQTYPDASTLQHTKKINLE